ncbi:MAG: hypothetical protein FJZ92_13080 [Chloroflexi bacterium]|nr:hypothetical protein [Chloroflexota bacterium]
MSPRPLLSLAVAVLVLAACSNGSADAPGDEPSAAPPSAGMPVPPAGAPGGSPAPTRPPAQSPPPQAPPGTRIVAAPIGDARVDAPPTLPPTYVLHVVSGLQNGCTRFHGVHVGRAGTHFEVAVENTTPTAQNIACTMIYGLHESRTELPGPFAAGARYTVDVNGERALSFVAR